MASVLVAEHDPNLGPLVALVLRQRGHVVKLVTNGCDALDSTRRDQFDAVVTCLALPCLNGEELARGIRLSGDRPEVPIVLFTASAFPQKVSAALEAGVNEYLPKPWGVTRLANCVERLTRKPDSQA